MSTKLNVDLAFTVGRLVESKHGVKNPQTISKYTPVLIEAISRVITSKMASNKGSVKL